MAKRSDVILGVLIGGSILVLLIFIIALFSVTSTDKGVGLDLGQKVAIIDVHGVISRSDGIIRQLKRYKEDNSIPSIVLHIDSPGGGVAASQEIYEEVNKVRQEGKKVVASMGSVAASGGYYVACASDTIVANPGTITGSIGVIFEWPVAEELFKKIGLRFEVVKSGRLKDVGSMARQATAEERRILQEVIDDTYEQFVEVCVKARHISRKKFLPLADGRIFTGRQALNLGLVDTLGDLEDAIKIAAEMGGIKGKPRTIKERPVRITFWDVLFQKLKLLQSFPDNEALIPKLQYIFK